MTRDTNIVNEEPPSSSIGRGLVLPFKPFTADEVKAITGITSGLLDKWWGTPRLPLCQGSGTVGIDWMHTFATFVAWRYHQENAGPQRCNLVVLFVASLTPEEIERREHQGHTFVKVDLTQGVAALMSAPDSRAGRLLALPRLYREFLSNVARVFPRG